MKGKGQCGMVLSLQPKPEFFVVDIKDCLPFVSKILNLCHQSAVSMKRIFTFLVFLFPLLPSVLFAQCTLANWTSVANLGPANFPYFAAGPGITVTASAPGVPTLGNSSYTCGAQTFACASPTWWLNSTGHILTLGFSCPIARFSVVVNGTNQGEIFTFTGNAGTTTLTDYCTNNFSTVLPHQLIDNAVPATGTLITVNNNVGATSYQISHNGVGSGSRISVLNCFVCAGPFAVNMTSFAANYQPDLQDVMLNWETVSEVDARGFEVQHSLNGDVWDVLGFVESVGAAQGGTYSFTHAQPVQGSNLYRLRIVDQNADYRFSEIQSVDMSPVNPEASIYPNPSEGRFQVRAAGRKGSLSVTDLLGRVVYTQAFDSQLELDLGVQPKGVYLVKITDQRNHTTSQRLVLE